MKPTVEAIVGRAGFIKSVARSAPKRAPVGARAAVPKDVLLYRDGDALIVDAPAFQSRLPMTGAWPVCVSVKAASSGRYIRNPDI